MVYTIHPMVQRVLGIDTMGQYLQCIGYIYHTRMYIQLLELQPMDSIFPQDMYTWTGTHIHTSLVQSIEPGPYASIPWYDIVQDRRWAGALQVYISMDDNSWCHLYTILLVHWPQWHSLGITTPIVPVYPSMYDASSNPVSIPMKHIYIEYLVEERGYGTASTTSIPLA